jgi:hypothetical protein
VILPVNRALWPAEWFLLWQERAAIMEFDGHMSRDKAELEAENDVRRIVEREA